MRYRKVTVYLFTLLLAAAAAVLWRLEPQTEVMPVSLIAASEEGEKVISCWKSETDEYYLFLPGYAERSTTRLQLHADNVKIGDKSLETGMACDSFTPDTPYSFSYDAGAGEVHSTITFAQSGGLSTLFIDTGSGNMDYIHGKKGNQESGRMDLYTPDGKLSYAGTLDKIQGRGNEWQIPKKSYSLQLASGADLLGMGTAEKWILVSNAYDPSHLRNKLVYDFAGAAGLAYSPESRWVDLYLNGEYAGLYLLCERNELHEQRISLEGETQYLVSMDVPWRLEENARPFVTTQSGTAFRIHSSQISDAQLLQLLQSVENAISAEDGRDPLTGKHWTELIDPDSWVRKYLVEEIFGNGDAGSISQYFYGTGTDTPICAGPVWDYDISMGNALGKLSGGPQSLFAGRSRVLANTSFSWYYALSQQSAFQEQLTAVYQQAFLPLLDTFLHGKLDEYVAQIAQASAMNQLRWEIAESSPQETENIRSFLEARIAFLDQLWLEEKPFLRILIDTDEDHGTICHAVLPGETIPSLPDYEDSWEIMGWYDADTEEPFDITGPIYRDTRVYLKKLPTEEEQISPLQYGPFAVVVILLLAAVLADSRRRRAARAKVENPIAKQEIM